jgi:alpha-N-arabinofuranosidase
MVSLFPADAVRGLFRRDLFDALLELRPAFMRFPGGDYTDWYHWEETLGPEEARPGHYRDR